MIDFNNHNFKLLLPTVLITILLSACGGGSGGGDSGAGGFTGTTTTGTTTNTKPQLSSDASVAATSAQSEAASSSLPIPTVQSSSSPTPKSSLASSSSSSSNASLLVKISSSSVRSSKNSTDLDVTPPTAPADFAPQTLLYDRAILSWKPSMDNVSVASYKIYRDQVQLETISGNDNVYYDFDVAAGKSYTYSISAGDSSGNWSTIISVEAKTPNGPVNQTSSAASSLGISASSITAVSSVKANSSTASVSSVQAISSIASSASSASLANVDLAKPSLPDQLTKMSVYATQANISWTAATDNVAVTSYKIYRNSILVKTLDANTFTFTDDTVTPGTSYWYGVSAGDAAGNWSSQKLLNVITPALVAQSSPTLKWIPPFQRENGTTLSPSEIGGYELRYKTILDNKYQYKLVENNITQLILTGLLSGDYSFEISAFDTDGLYSNFVSIKAL